MEADLTGLQATLYLDEHDAATPENLRRLYNQLCRLCWGLSSESSALAPETTIHPHSAVFGLMPIGYDREHVDIVLRQRVQNTERQDAEAVCKRDLMFDDREVRYRQRMQLIKQGRAEKHRRMSANVCSRLIDKCVQQAKVTSCSEMDEFRREREERRKAAKADGKAPKAAVQRGKEAYRPYTVLDKLEGQRPHMRTRDYFALSNCVIVQSSGDQALDHQPLHLSMLRHVSKPKDLQDHFANAYYSMVEAHLRQPSGNSSLTPSQLIAEYTYCHCRDRDNCVVFDAIMALSFNNSEQDEYSGRGRPHDRKYNPGDAAANHSAVVLAVFHILTSCVSEQRMQHMLQHHFSARTLDSIANLYIALFGYNRLGACFGVACELITARLEMSEAVECNNSLESQASC